MEKIKISIEKKQITELSNAFIFRHKRKAVAIVESSVDLKTCSKIWKYCLFPTRAGGLYGGKEIKGAMRFSNGECLYNYAN